MFRIRFAQPGDDFKAVAQLYLTAWRETYRPWLPAAWLAKLTPAVWHPERNWRQTLLAFEGQQLVGVCAFGPARDASFTGWGELRSIYLLTSAQHRGLGRDLVTQARATLQQAGFNQVVLWVLAENTPAQQFYQRLGFRQTTVQKTQGIIREIAYVWPADGPAASNGE
ncbi:GNAT family N-acetyltransferase [Levilactobacillus enshiensis]|uniref:GNAT family N-acetyltransferase n=1 Tax=Levilactobacillus enshiensis TaxID=2590213 RepID=UPI00117AA5D0|nr:GNAT family N-acetyltransferase [Levilactobacillus enshiensis]